MSSAVTPPPDAGRVLPPEILSRLSGAGKPLEVAPGTVLFRKGDAASTMLIIDRGHVEVHVGDGEPPRRFEAGALIGELALLAPSGTRTATVVAGADCRVVVVDTAQFEALLRERPDLACEALRHACAYLVESERRLVDGLQRRNAELEAALDYLRRTREELDASEIKAQTDSLCDLYNRRCLDRQLPRFIESERAEGSGLALLMIDLDKFKPINDRFGHPAGDAVLRGVASVLRRSVRASDLASRLGGDEFAVLLAPAGPSPGFDPARSACSMRQAIAANEVHAPEGVLRVGATIGGTIFSPGDSAETLMARADKYLYEAKAAGRNLVCWEGRILA